MRYYASLIGPLRGYYLELPKEIDTHIKARVAASTGLNPELWCSVISEARVNALIDDHGGAKLPLLPGAFLNYDWSAVESVNYQLVDQE